MRIVCGMIQEASGTVNADSSLLSEIRGGVGSTICNGSGSLIVYKGNNPPFKRTAIFGRVYSARMFCGLSPPHTWPDEDDIPNARICLYISERWVLFTTFDITTGFPVGKRRPILVYRNLRGARAFRDVTFLHMTVIFLFQNASVTNTLFNFDMLGHR